MTRLIGVNREQVREILKPMESLTNTAEKIAISIKGEDSSKEESEPSKNALKKAAKEAEKAKKKAETAARLAAQKAIMHQEAADFSQGKYGKLPLIQSTTRSGITSLTDDYFTKFKGRSAPGLMKLLLQWTGKKFCCAQEFIIFVCKVQALE
jgi:hypothetical protein